MTAKDDKGRVSLRTGSRNDDPFVEIRESKAGPPERTPRPRGDAVEVSFLVDAGKIAKLIFDRDGLFDVTANTEFELPCVVGETARELPQPETRELVYLVLTRR